MKTLALTIGIGGGWREVAERAAVRMTAATGLPAQVISSCQFLPPEWNPSWAKCWAFDLVPADVERLLIFDADIWAVAPFTEWDTDQPLAVVRHVATKPVRVERALYGLPDYWNGGLFVIRRSLADALRMVATYGPHYGSWLEQTAINRVFEYCDKAWLPGRCNHLLKPTLQTDTAIGGALGAIESGATCLHFAGFGGSAAKVAAIYDELERLT